MKIPTILSILLLSCSVAHADDIADAKTAFATLLDNQKAASPTNTKLAFTSDYRIGLTEIDGQEKRTGITIDPSNPVLPQLFATQTRAKDAVCNDAAYVQDGAAIKVAATIQYAQTGKLAPFAVLYVRDNGTLKIKEMQFTLAR